MSRIPNLRICHTTVEDEEIHLASAMPCAGFCSRAVDDGRTRAALALNETAYTIRSTDSLHPSRCLVVAYPRSLSRFAILALAVCDC